MNTHILRSVLAALLAATFSPLAFAAENEAATGQASITIESVGEPTLAPDHDLTLTVAIANPTKSPLDITGLTVKSQIWPATHASHVSAWMAGETHGYTLQEESTELTIPAGQTIKKTITVPRANITWSSTAYAWGPRGIEIEANTGKDAALTDRSFVVVTPNTELPRTQFTTILPITNAQPQTALSGYDLIAHALTTDHQAIPTGGTAGSSAYLWDIPGITAVSDPNVPISAPFKNAELHALPAFDADLAALTHAGATDRIPTFTRSAAPDIFVPAGPTDLATLRAVRAAGIPAAIVPDSQLTPAIPQLFTAHAHTGITIDGSIMPILTADTTLSNAISGTLTNNDQQIRLDALDRRQTALAMSAILYRQQPNNQRAVVALLDRGASTRADAVTTRDIVTALVNAPWNEASSVSNILATPATGYEFEDLPESQVAPGELDAAGLAQYDAAVAAVHNLASIFGSPDDLGMSVDSYSAQFLGTQWRWFPAQRAEFVKALGFVDKSLLRIEASSTINLISESSALPIHVTNGYDFPVEVTVTLRTPDSRLRALSPTKVTVPAKSTAQAMVPVEAWGSGDLDIEARLSNDAGLTVGESSSVHVRVRANWENWGTLIVAGLVGGLFLAGVVKSIRKGRRSQPVDPQEAGKAIKERAENASKPLSPDAE
ncbi:hypothetical protein EBF03_08810 [Arcanobacterium haemolyticum]|uniref:DUF6049 family protein n=1 Tax=Arcanobacterium haemolyticum TaxID=28264 RepID=UPI0011101AF2|nr:DUF6049 family protein [Arcanobacterium haemolyticum]QCX47473.1 hypothetical protein EBF03_08810 [Arcanobacterium haemolyticum]